MRGLDIGVPHEAVIGPGLVVGDDQDDVRGEIPGQYQPPAGEHHEEKDVKADSVHHPTVPDDDHPKIHRHAGDAVLTSLETTDRRSESRSSTPRNPCHADS